ncbi:hypothetical protein AKJ16_DCAP12538 [Drosera capensis]
MCGGDDGSLVMDAQISRPGVDDGRGWWPRLGSGLLGSASSGLGKGTCDDGESLVMAAQISRRSGSSITRWQLTAGALAEHSLEQRKRCDKLFPGDDKFRGGGCPLRGEGMVGKEAKLH